ncbi:MAG TPA: pilus assembly protein PilM [Sedimentisphaerales bacterium]|nr:pilus assembly protein PilM [Sedimentisphaerales bacterium]
MVKRCIGIDIGSSHLQAVQVSRTGDQFRLEKVFSTKTQRITDSPAEILRSLTRQYGFDRHAQVAVSMPHDAVFFRNLETPITGLEQILARDSSALEHNFPIESDEIVVQICSYRPLPEEKCSVLAAAAAKKSVSERLNLLAGANMSPDLIDAAIFAIHAAVTVNHPEIASGRAIIAHINESHLTLAVTQNSSILVVRNVPISCPSENNSDTDSVQRHVAGLLSREAELTWRRLFGAPIEPDTRIYLVAEQEDFSSLKATIEEDLHCQTTFVDPYAKVKCTPECTGDEAICVAEGLALRVLASEKTTGVNFLEADNAETRPTLHLKKELLTFGGLAAAIVIVLLAGLFMRLSHLEKVHANIKNEIKEVFQHTLPEEKNIVDPLIQLEQRLKSLRTDNALSHYITGAGVEPLDILRAITASVPSGANINIDNMLITTESVRLAGACRSFESVYNWQQRLQETGLFSTVVVRDNRKDSAGGLVRFTILLSLAEVEQK